MGIKKLSIPKADVLLINVDFLNLLQPIIVPIQILKQKKSRLNLLNLPALINVDLLNLPKPINGWMDGWMDIHT